MVRSINDLRAATDDELIAEHDKLAVHTVPGTAYYTDELRRREAERAESASYQLSRSAYRLAVVNGWLAGVSAIAAVAAIIVAIVK
ncbi:hypothetical protein BOH72_23445 [Mycobacterium sp. WY10]|nr:hypothetical protein BOH72_23445 [Mycobacterium sp. WY10]